MASRPRRVAKGKGEGLQEARQTSGPRKRRLRGLESSESLPDRDASCRRCPRWQGTRVVCMDGDGPPGGVLVVAAYPGVEEDRVGKPQRGLTGRYLRSLLPQVGFLGPVRYTNVLRCAGGPPSKDWTRDVAACGGFLAREIARVRPVHIVAMGREAIAAFSSDVLSVETVRGGGTWFQGIPVTFVGHVAAARRERGSRLRRFIREVRGAATEPSVLRWQGVDEVQIQVVTEEEEAIQLLGQLRGREVSWDVETSGPWHDQAWQVLCIGFSARPDRAGVLSREVLARPRVRAALAAWAGDAETGHVAHNAKFDMAALRVLGVTETGPVVGDPSIWRRLENSESDRDLDQLAYRVGLGGFKFESLEAVAQTRRGFEVAFGLIDPAILHRRCAWDAVAAYRLHEDLAPRVRGSPWGRAWGELLQPALPVFARMEAAGVGVDVDRLEKLSQFLRARIEQVRQDIGRLPEVAQQVEETGECNLNSSPQLGELLYKRVGLPVLATTPGGKPSTDRFTLQALRFQHPLPDLILLHRWLEKRRSTYADGLVRHVRSDGRVHTTFNLDGAATGRLSSTKPNLQNIVSSKEESPGEVEMAVGRMIRSVFVPRPGFVFLGADYKQLELCVAADLSGDREMRSALETEDFHRETAAAILDISLAEVTSDQRRRAKSVVFRILFGDDEFGVSQAVGCSETEAAQYIRKVLGRFSQLKKFMDGCVRAASRDGEVWTWGKGGWMRRRFVPDILSSDRRAKRHAKRVAINTPIQGTASDICLDAAARLGQLPNRPYRLVLSVHDELVFEVSRGEVEEAAREIVSMMTDVESKSGVRFQVDVTVGDDWGSMRPFSLTGGTE